MSHASDHGYSIEGQLPASCGCAYCESIEVGDGTVLPTYAGRFVNVYLTDRAFGGPEEGGWWYDVGQLVSSTQARPWPGSNQECLLRQAQAWCEEENARRRSDVSSVLSEGRYVALVECGPGRDYPAERPRYE